MGLGVYIWQIMGIHFMVFFERRSEIYLLLFTSSKILILDKVIIGQRSAIMCNSITCAIFNRITRKWPFSVFKLYRLLHFLSNHPETSGCSIHNTEDIFWSKFWFRPLNRNHDFLKIFDLIFWNLKISKFHQSKFWPTNIFIIMPRTYHESIRMDARKMKEKT